MKKILLSICCFYLLFLIGCDTIEEEKYSLSIKYDDTLGYVDSIEPILKDIQYHYDKNVHISLTANPKEDVIFNGWYNADNGDLLSNEIIYSFNLKQNINILCKFEIRKFKISINYDNDEETRTYLYNNGDSVSEVIKPEKKGYIFIGWMNENNEVVIIPSIMPNRDLTFMAKWEKVKTEVITISGDVKKIENDMYKDRLDIIQVIIDANITLIEKNAFSGCKNLKSIILPNSLETIESEAFADCVSLTNINIPSSVIYIGNNVFKGCVSIVINCETIEKPLEWSEYWNCDNAPVIWLERSHTITLIYNNEKEDEVLNYNKNETVKVINDPIKDGYIFLGWMNEKGNLIKIPTTMPDYDMMFYARWEKENPGTLIISENITSIENSKYKKRLDIEKVIIISKITSIGELAFSGCTNLKNIEFPNTLRVIESYAFYDCINLESIDFPEGMTKIGSNAFENCTKLSSIFIPSRITKIEHRAFFNCSNLMSICVDKNNVNYDSRDNCNAIIESKYNSLYMACSTTIIPNGITNIYENAFYGCAIKKIVFPNSIQEIKGFVFKNCYDLFEISIPVNVTKIDSSAFENCFNIEKITVDERNPFYDSRDNCNAIIETATNTLVIGCSTTIIPESVVKIGYGAFSGCSKLISIHIPNSIIEIGSSAFFDCTNLINVNIPESIDEINYDTFFRCQSLVSIEIPNTVTAINGSAFSVCSSLVNIRIPENVTFIGRNAFSGCSSLEEINIPSGVTSIEDFTFEGCSKLKVVNIPSGVIRIGYQAFCCCFELSNIDLPNNLISIDSEAFRSCHKLKSIFIPSNVINVGSSILLYATDTSILCEASTKPSGWDDNWNINNTLVTWNAKKDNK